MRRQHLVFLAVAALASPLLYLSLRAPAALPQPAASAPAPARADRALPPPSTPPVPHQGHRFRREERAFSLSLGAWGARLDERGLHLSASPSSVGVTLGHARVEGVGGPSEGAPRLREEPDGQVAFALRGATERFRSLGEAVEITWTVPAPPPAAVPLAFTVPVEGARLDVEDDAGVRLALAESGRIRVGHGTWIDAAGRRTHVPARFATDGIRYEIPGEVVRASRFPAVLDPIIHPEQNATAPSYVPSFGWFPRAASDGTRYLVAWSDPLSGLRASLVDSAGAIQTLPEGLEVASNSDPSSTRVVFDGSRFLVVWADPMGIRARRMATDGTLTAGITLRSGQHYGHAIAWSGSQYLLVYATSGGVLLAVRLNRDLALLDPAPIALSSDVNLGKGFAVATGGGIFAVSWIGADGRSVRVARLTPSGTVLDPGGAQIAVGSDAVSRAVSVASDGVDFLVAWAEGSGRPARVSRVSAAGGVLDPGGVTLPESAYSTAAIYDGTSYLVALEFGAVRVARVDHSATVLAPGFQTLGTGTDPAMASHRGNVLLAYCRQSVLARTFTPALTPISSQESPISQQPAAESLGSLACSTTKCLATWRTESTPSAARFGLDGTPLDPDGLDSVPTGLLASDGTDFLLAWKPNYGSVRVKKILDSGQVVEPLGALSLVGQEPLSLASGAQHYLLVLRDPHTEAVFVRRLDREGRSVDATSIALPSAHGTLPTAAAGPQGYLLAWARPQSVSVLRLGADARPLDPAPIALPLTGHPLHGAVFDGANYLVGAGSQIARVSAAGSVVDVVPFSMLQPLRPGSLAFDGSVTWIAWVETTETYPAKVARVDRFGSVLDFGGTVLSNEVDPFEPVALASAGDGSTLAAYRRGARLRLRRLSQAPAPLGAWCSRNADCLSGHCVDRVCCDGPCGGGDPGDCLACSVEAGAVGDGACGLRAPTTICRAAAGPCDLPERCGGAAACPPDAVRPPGHVCKAAAGCLSEATCDGVGSVCPPPLQAADGAGCDDKNPCTTDEQCLAGYCHGTSLPITYPAPCVISACLQSKGPFVAAFDDGSVCDPGSPCRGPGTCAGGVCVAPLVACDDGCSVEVCTEAGPCTREALPDGTPCDDGDACTRVDLCQAGVCHGGAPVTCPAPGPCEAAVVCLPATGSCLSVGHSPYASVPCGRTSSCSGGWCRGTVCEETSYCSPTVPCRVNSRCDLASDTCLDDPAPDGTACDDRDPCTEADRCLAGACVGTPLACAAIDSCHLSGTCTSGRCTSPLAPDGTACTTTSGCVLGGQCIAGSCGVALACPAPADPCRVSTGCDPESGQCLDAPAPEGWPCDDGDPCTEADACRGGSCAGLARLCEPLHACQAAGTCDPATGACINAPSPEGTACDDGNACTSGDACLAGTCAAGAVVKTCPPSSEPCHIARCDPSTGYCRAEPAPDGTKCDDHNPCTETDRCAAGACVGADPLVCPDPQDACKLAATCDPHLGCVYPVAPYGTPCDDGERCTDGDACRYGLCVGTARSCGPAGPCGQPACDPATGLCATDSSREGTACDDQNPCTSGERCQAGACQGTGITCPDPGPCRTAPRCDLMTGACFSSPAADGTACDDGDACTGGDRCASGACRGEPLACDAPGPCQLAACDPALGCVASPRADGDACDDADPCTTGDQCRAGACEGSPLTCAPEGPCLAAACDPLTGACASAPLVDGTSCDDANACTTGDECLSGACGGSPVACAAEGACLEAACDPLTGACASAPLADGTSCDDANPCTSQDRCLAGVCGGAALECSPPDRCHSSRCEGGACVASPVVCQASGECVAASCDLESGECRDAPRPDGTACARGTCRGGICTALVVDDSGCGCGATGGAPPLLLLGALLAFAALARRRST